MRHFSVKELLPDDGTVFVNNKYTPSLNSRFLDIINPATEKIVYRSAICNRQDVDHAVSSANEGLSKWGSTSPRERGRYLYRISELMLKYRDELAFLETMNVGKPINATKNREVSRAADVVRYYAGWCDKITGVTNQISSTHTLFTLEEPVGIVGAIVPWNFPLIIACYKIAPALACGNAVVLKPSEYSPLTALFLGKIIQEAGVPEGVVNVIPGDGTTGRLLVESNVNKIAFTGSIPTGKEIMKRASSSFKRIHLELGGKSPHIIFDDADIEKSFDSALNGIFYNSGQVCIAGSRLFVQKGVHDEYVSKLKQKVSGYKVGDPFDETTSMGPIANRAQYDKVLGYIEKAKVEKAIAVTGARKTGSQGYFIEPTIFDRVSPDMTIAREEIFGPVLSCIEFENIDHLIKLANDTIYGLAAGCWTKDINKAMYFARQIKSGIVWVNSFYCMDPVSPFGGFKQSGFGRDLGRESLFNYTETKSIIINHVS